MENTIFEWQGKTYHGARLMGELFAPARREQYDPQLWQRFGHLRKKRFLRRYLRHVQSLFALAKEPIAGRDILDCGADFGLPATFLAFMGAKTAHSLEPEQSQVDTFEALRTVFPADLPVFVRQGDAAAMPYKENSFDVILSMDAISHCRDITGFLKETHRVLRPGGVLIVADVHNGANPWQAKRLKRKWVMLENGREGGSFHGRHADKSFLQYRREIISEAFPFLNQDVVDDLARGTSGLSRGEILAVVHYFVETGAKPQHFYQYGTCPLDPVTNQYATRLFHPLKLRDEMAYFEFDAQAYAYFGGSRSSRMAKINDWMTHKVPTPLIIWLANAFRLVARKKA